MKRPFGVLVAAVVVSMALGGMALAGEHEGGEEETPEVVGTLASPEILIDEVGGLLYISLPIEDGEPAPCPPEEEPPVDPESTDGAADGDGDDAEALTEGHEMGYMPGDCVEVDFGNHPSGEKHHGAIVSSTAKKLHPSMLKAAGVKKGHIMRYVAKGIYVPVPTDEGAEGTEDGGDGGATLVEPESAADKPARGNSENAKNKDKPNKGKKNR